MTVQLLSYGAITQAINVPGKNGKTADVVLGFKTLQDYVANDSPPVTANGGPYFGETVGRYANRIAKGTFQLNGQTYTLPINNGVNSLHGGLVGFGNHIWSQVGGLIHTSSEVGVTLQLVSPNGDSSGAAGSPGCTSACTGYPAQLTVDVTFTLNSQGQYVDPLQGAQRRCQAEHGPQPHQPQLLQPRGRELGGRLGLRPESADQRQPVLADRQHADPAAAAQRRPGRGHAVRLPRAAHHRLADQRRERDRTTLPRASARPPGARASCSSPRATTTTGSSTSRRARPPARTASTWPPAPGTRAAAARWPSGPTSRASSSTAATSSPARSPASPVTPTARVPATPSRPSTSPTRRTSRRSRRRSSARTTPSTRRRSSPSPAKGTERTPVPGG